MEARDIIVDVGDLSWVKAGRSRKKILRSMEVERYYSASDLGEAAGLSTRSAGKILRIFEARGIVECATPDARRGRLYILTRKGRNLASNL